MKKIYIAPIAGVTDYTFRGILEDFKPDLIFTEMVSVNALSVLNDKTISKILKLRDGNAVQIFGEDIEKIKSSAQYIQNLGVKHINLNCGCPMKKIVNCGYGAALVREPEKIKRILSEIIEPVREHYDYILIDTSPALGILTINALCAADSVLITADTQMFAVVGINELLKTVQKIKKRVNSKLKVKGILLTMCDNRTNLYKTLTEQVEEMFQGRIKVFQTKIPKTVKVGEAIYSGQSIKKYAKGSSVDVAYDNLAKEICHE